MPRRAACSQAHHLCRPSLPILSSQACPQACPFDTLTTPRTTSTCLPSRPPLPLFSHPPQEVSAEANTAADEAVNQQDENPNFSDSDGVSPAGGGLDPFVAPKLLLEHVQ